MNERIKSPAFWAGILGALKLATDAFGVNLLSDDQVNAIANGIATLALVVGVGAGYLPKIGDKPTETTE
jgi:uncharacterized membrane protein